MGFNNCQEHQRRGSTIVKNTNDVVKLLSGTLTIKFNDCQEYQRQGSIIVSKTIIVINSNEYKQQGWIIVCNTNNKLLSSKYQRRLHKVYTKRFTKPFIDDQ